MIHTETDGEGGEFFQNELGFDNEAKEARPARKKRVHVYKKDNEKIVSMAMEGYTERQIAEALDVTVQTVGRHCRISGVNFMEMRRRRKDKVREMVSECAKDGVSVGETAERIGISRASVTHYRQKLGISKYKKISKEQKQSLLELVKNGSLVVDAAKKLGLSYDAACRVCRVKGLTKPDETRIKNLENARKRRNSKAGAALELLKKGYSIDRVMRESGISANYVHQLREKVLGLRKSDWEAIADGNLDRLLSVQKMVERQCGGCKEFGEGCAKCRLATLAGLLNNENAETLPQTNPL